MLTIEKIGVVLTLPIASD